MAVDKTHPGTFVFDSHVHVGGWVTPDFRGHSTTLAQTAKVLEDCGIGGALVMPTDSGANDWLADAVAAYRGPVRFLQAFWALPDEHGLEAILGRADYRAIKIHPSFCRRPVTDTCWAPALRAAADTHLPVVVHCGRWQEMAGYGLLLDVADRWPDVNFVMAHMGGDSPALVIAAARAVAARRLKNVFMGTESIREYWLLASAIEIVGADRVLFGSDHNLNSPASFLAVIDAAGLSTAERAAILSGNARRLFDA